MLMEWKWKVSLVCLPIAAAMVVLFAQTSLIPAPLTDKEKLQAAEAFILLQNSQQKMVASPQWRQMVASPQWRQNQQRQQDYRILLLGFRKAKGAAPNCTLTIKQEWSCPVPQITQSTPGPNVAGDEEKEPDDPTPTPK